MGDETEPVSAERVNELLSEMPRYLAGTPDRADVPGAAAALLALGATSAELDAARERVLEERHEADLEAAKNLRHVHFDLDQAEDSIRRSAGDSARFRRLWLDALELAKQQLASGPSGG